MRLEPIGNPIEEKAVEVAGLLSGWTADAVGGRNLLPGSSAEPTEMDLPERLHYRDITEDTLLEVGQEYTFSVIVDKLSDDDHSINIQVGTGTGSNYTRDILMRYNITLGERTIITFTPTEHHLDGRTHFAWRIRNQQNETKVAYREAKLERGPVATPWTPAPEDSAQSLLEGNPLSSLPSPFLEHDPTLALRVDNSVGTRVFVGDTMVYGDTGTLEIDRDAVKSGSILLSRQGPLVHVHFDQVVFHDAPGNVHLSRLPISYRPAGDVRFSLYTVGSQTTTRSANISRAGYFNIYGTDEDTSLSGQTTFRTHSSWPPHLYAPTVTN